MLTLHPRASKNFEITEHKTFNLLIGKKENRLRTVKMYNVVSGKQEDSEGEEDSIADSQMDNGSIMSSDHQQSERSHQSSARDRLVRNKTVSNVVSQGVKKSSKNSESYETIEPNARPNNNIY